jgi:DNA-binding NarL/FixJ family response regulator
MYAPEGETAPAVQAMDDFLAILPRTAFSEPILSDLSPREIEVLRLVAAGKTNQLIADELIISPNTVAHHVQNILEKTESANRAEATSYAHRQGLV